MNDALQSILVGTSGLSLAALVALVLTWYRAPGTFRRDQLARTNSLVAACVALQTAHFIEEYATHFCQRFPGLFGLRPWSTTFFVSFNLFWLVVWVIAPVGLRSRSRIAIFSLWFLAIAMIANGVAHPMLALRAGGYFPGLVTAPIVGIAGVALCVRLLSLTRRAGPSPARPSTASEVP